ncbi:MAG TPA: branched-chain amino acid ABC transporter permease [Candidatus Scatomorpha intestinavium]|uniref:Branched-chain amino acid ABC transporter permease n=1 Tax=Candidatus Scatomorpha intestinavium TaxID=2840922 RepID=A0A9D1CSA6_9FIRM|nr:branched-chain amino acid ABC transporter permease [Candidatus Scatomorpha intestinavium]
MSKIIRLGKNRSIALTKTRVMDFATYLGVIIAFAVVTAMGSAGMLTRSFSGQLVPICCYIVMAISLNLTVGILGELSLGHAGFMSVGAFSGVIAAMSLQGAIPSDPLRLGIAMAVGAAFAALAGLIVGVPVLRLRGDYLAIVTLAFGEIIKELINCLIVGYDENGLHIVFNATGTKSVADLGLTESGIAIIKGAQGATGTDMIASFTGGFVLIMISLIIVLNLVRSRSGRAIMALRDNRIAAESVGINVTKYKLMAFVTSAALAGAAGALYGLNFSNLAASKFNFNTSILILVFVVLGGLGNIWGSIIAATVLTILPEALRGFEDYRMLAYAIVLILVMLATNNPQLKELFSKPVRSLKSQLSGGAKKGGAAGGQN